MKIQSQDKIQYDGLFVILAVLYSVALMIMLATLKKIVDLPYTELNASAGTLLGYVFCFLITDIVSELYGYKAARKVVIIGLTMQVLAIGLLQFSIYLPGTDLWSSSASHSDVFKLEFKLIAVGLLGFILAQQADMWIYHKLKHATHGKMLWLRNNVSTIIGQLIDSLTWPVVGLWGTVTLASLANVVTGEYLVKVGIAILDTFIIYLVLKVFLKKRLKAYKESQYVSSQKL